MIKATIKGTDAVFILETEEDLKRFFAYNHQYGWAICQACDKPFRENVQGQLYCPRVISSKCASRGKQL